MSIQAPGYVRGGAVARSGASRRHETRIKMSLGLQAINHINAVARFQSKPSQRSECPLQVREAGQQPYAPSATQHSTAKFCSTSRARNLL